MSPERLAQIKAEPNQITMHTYSAGDVPIIITQEIDYCGRAVDIQQSYQDDATLRRTTYNAERQHHTNK